MRKKNNQDSAEEAINAKEGYLLVVAPGGFGKTDILTQRLANFLSEEVNEDRSALCVTFTRGAADEMLSRIKNTSGKDSGEFSKHQKNLDISTLHSVCKCLLDQYSNHSNKDEATNSAYTLLKDESKRELIAKAYFNVLSERKRQKSKFKTGLPQRLYSNPLRLFSKAGEYELERVENLYYDAADRLCHTLLQRELANSGEEKYSVPENLLLYKDYQEKPVPGIKKAHQSLVRDAAKELLCLKYINDASGRYYKVDYDDILCRVWDLLKRKKIPPRYDFVQVDEVQDISPLQLDIIRKLTKKGASVAYFGDKNQAIFSFMGGCPENIDKIKDEVESHDGTICILKKNLRSTKRLMKFQSRFLNKFLPVDDANAAYLELKSGVSSRGLCELDDKVTIKGYQAQKRQNADVVEMASSMLKGEHPVKEVAILCRSNQECRMFDNAFRKKGEVAYRFSEESFSAMKDINYLFKSIETDFNHSYSMVKSFAKEFETRIDKSKPDNPIANLLVRYVACLEKIYEKLIPDKVTPDEFFEIIKESKVEDVYMTKDANGENLIRNSVIISTVHKSKGKSFEAVIVPSVVEGVYPYKKSIHRETEKEGARVFYVAISRASKRLVITYYENGTIPRLHTDKYEASSGKHKKAKVSVRTYTRPKAASNLKPSRFIRYKRGTKVEIVSK